MITLATAIKLADFNRVEASSINLNFKTKEAIVGFLVGGVGAVNVTVRNGECVGIRKNPDSTGPHDVIDSFNMNKTTGFDDLVRGGITPKQIEASGIAAGWIDESLTGAVT